MIKVGALDLGQTNGVAVGTPDRAPFLGTARLLSPIGGTDFGRTIDSFMGWIGGTEAHIGWLEEYRPDRLYIEAPFAAQRRTGADLTDYIANQFAYAGIVDGFCHRLGIPLYVVRVNDVRMHFCGTQNPGDPLIKRTCEEIGWRPKNEHEADAAALWHFAVVDQLELETPFKLPVRNDAGPLIPQVRRIVR